VLLDVILLLLLLLLVLLRLRTSTSLESASPELRFDSCICSLLVYNCQANMYSIRPCVSKLQCETLNDHDQLAVIARSTALSIAACERAHLFLE
jgi:hypothetical protein